MPDMTDILTAHVYNKIILNCECMMFAHRNPEMTHAEWAAHVAAALETAGYGQVTCVTEWGSEHVIEGKRAIEFHVWPDQNTALEKVGQYGGTLVSRTVTAWKKEA